MTSFYLLKVDKYHDKTVKPLTPYTIIDSMKKIEVACQIEVEMLLH